MQDGGSSSPSDNLVIRSIHKTRGTVPALRVEVVEGSSFLCPPALAREYGLRPGVVLEAETVQSLQTRSEEHLAYHKILDLLARREYTRKELELRLIKKGFSRESRDHALDRAVDQKVISHSRYSEDWIRGRLRKHPESTTLLTMGLVQRGVDKATARSIITAMLEDEPDLEYRLCLDAAKQLSARNIDGEKLPKKLLSRGFSMAVIRRSAREIEKITGLPIHLKF